MNDYNPNEPDEYSPYVRSIADMVRVEIEQVEQEVSRLKEENQRLNDAYEEVSRRLRNIIRRNHRVTRLLRSALPQAQQIGCGYEGMIESLLAFALGRVPIPIKGEPCEVITTETNWTDRIELDEG